MKKIFYFIFLFSLFITNSFAEKWSRYGETKSIVIYVDRSSWVYGELYSKLDILYDFKKPVDAKEGKTNSMILSRKFNCKDMSFVDVKQTFFKKKMGQEPFFEITDQTEPKKISGFTTTDGNIFKAACKIK